LAERDLSCCAERDELVLPVESVELCEDSLDVEGLDVDGLEDDEFGEAFCACAKADSTKQAAPRKVTVRDDMATPPLQRHTTVPDSSRIGCPSLDTTCVGRRRLVGSRVTRAAA
jgi:hypothetical protein